jgi:hypothetical protein
MTCRLRQVTQRRPYDHGTEVIDTVSGMTQKLIAVQGREFTVEEPGCSSERQHRQSSPNTESDPLRAASAIFAILPAKFV